MPNAGGLPPYRYRMTLSDNAIATGNASVAGRIDWVAIPVAAGYLTVQGSVTDSTGRTANVTFTVYVAPGTGTSGSSAGTMAGAGAIALAGAGAGAALSVFGAFAVRRWLRRRVPNGATARSGEAERTIVRELLADAEDGIDRSTLGLLAEERRVSPAVLDEAIAAWKRAGRVRVDEDGEGREVVRWIPRTPTPSPPEATESSGGPGGDP
ncbi:MAG: hypothetical protein ACREEC_12475 [Thermoplasmata archaeon]